MRNEENLLDGIILLKLNLKQLTFFVFLLTFSKFETNTLIKKTMIY